MFCAKCGQELDDNALVCPLCGKRIRRGRNNASSEDSFTWPTQSFPKITEAPEIPEMPEMPEIPEMSEIPEAPRRSKMRKAAIVLIILASAILLGVIGFFGFRLIYHSSNTFKVSQAAQLVLDGDIEKGLDAIRDVQSPQADATRQFAEMLRQRDAFAADYDADTLQTAAEPVKISYDKLTIAYSGFTDAENLPKTLKERYQQYSDRLTNMSKVLSDISVDTLTDAQSGVLAFGYRKRGGEFKISSLQNIVSVTKNADRKIRTKLTGTSAYMALSSHSKAKAVKAMDEFAQIIAAQLAQDEYDLNEYIEMDVGTRAVTLQDIDKSYQASVGEWLQPVNSEADAEKNASQLYTSLCYAWMAYAFDIP